MADTRAREIAEILTECEIPSRTPLHAARRAAHIETEARLIERVAALAGLSLDQLATRLAGGRSVADAAIAGVREDADA